MAVSEFSPASSSSSATDQESQQNHEEKASQTSSPRDTGREPGGPAGKHPSSSSSVAPRAGRPTAGQQRGAEAAAGGEAAKSGAGGHAGGGAAGQGKSASGAATPGGAGRGEKPAGVSSRRLSQLQMTHTMQTFADGRGGAGTAGAVRSTKQQKQQQERERAGTSGSQTGTGAASQQQPRWHGGSSIGSSRAIEFEKKKAGGGPGMRRMCLYGSGALWLPAHKLLGGYAGAPGVAGQPSGRDDLRVLLQQQQQESRTGDQQQPQPSWRSLATGGGRRNASSAVAAALVESNVQLEGGDLQPRPRPAIRSLRTYYGPEDLHCAFAQTLQLVNPLTGHTQVMAARKPGFAAAVVNIQDFDAYTSLQVPRPYSALRQKDSLQAGLMGLMPVAGAERLERTRVITAYPELKRSHLGCKGAFIAPLDDVAVCEKLAGQTKKRSGYRWATALGEVPYATWKDSSQWQPQQQQRQQRQGQQPAYLAGLDCWRQQLTDQQLQQEEGHLQQQERGTQQQQRMERDWQTWQGYQQQPQAPQQQQQKHGEVQEQRQQQRPENEGNADSSGRLRSGGSVHANTPMRGASHGAGLEYTTAVGVNTAAGAPEGKKTPDCASRRAVYTPNRAQSEAKGKPAAQVLSYQQQHPQGQQRGQQQPVKATQQVCQPTQLQLHDKCFREGRRVEDQSQMQLSHRKDGTSVYGPANPTGQVTERNKSYAPLHQEMPPQNELQQLNQPPPKEKQGTRLLPISGRQQQHSCPPRVV